MRLTAIDIAHKTFSKKMLGSDPNEVHDFLQSVSAQMELLTQERNSLKESLREKDLNIAELRERDKALKETINTASQMAERMRQDAEREAQLIKLEAEQRAEQMIHDTRESLKKMYQELMDLKKMRLQFEANLKAIAQAHISLVEQGEKYLPTMQLPDHTLADSPKSTSVSPLASR